MHFHGIFLCSDKELNFLLCNISGLFVLKFHYGYLLQIEKHL